MKFFLGCCILLLFFLSGTAFAQQPDSAKYMRKGTYKDGAAMLNGKMVQLENGKQLPLQKKQTMQNGTIVNPDGIVTIPGKKSAKLKEGMAVNMQGRIVIFKDDMFTPEAITGNSEEVGYEQNTTIFEQPDTIIIEKK